MSKSSEKYLYGPGGQLLESYRAWNDFTDYVYFGGRLLYTLSAGQALTRIYSDRLGSTRATETIQQFGGGWTTRNYYPFGEEIGSTANNEYKFASTYRDSATGLDYAINRYYASGMGRFLTTDPYKASAGVSDPQSWNRYSYTQGDPINYKDRTGLLMAPPWDDWGWGGGYACGPNWMWDASLVGPCGCGWGGCGGGWSQPDPLSIATGNILNQFPGLPFVDAQTVGRVVLAGGTVVCVGSGVCEVIAGAVSGAVSVALTGLVVYEAGRWLYAKIAADQELQAKCDDQKSRDDAECWRRFPYDPDSFDNVAKRKACLEHAWIRWSLCMRGMPVPPLQPTN